MTSLILTIISIVLLAAISVVSINYLPTWSRDRTETTALIKDSLEKLERGHNLYAQAHNGNVAPSQLTSDGGLSTNFTPAYLPFVPPAIVGYKWTYGVTDINAAPPYQSTAYFCLTPVTSGSLAGEGKIRGALGAAQYFSAEQFFVGPTCGATANSNYSTFPAQMSVTYFVKYIAG